MVDIGILPLAGWWTVYSGYVFNDTNRNGVMDWTDTNGDGCPQAGEGELGVPNFGVVLRRRDNSLMDRGTTAVGTDACGYYYFESAYPMTQWLVHGGVQRPLLHDRRHLPGRQPARTDHGARCGRRRQRPADHRPVRHASTGVSTPTTPAAPTASIRMNGGIVGTVSYDTTRNELDPRFAAVEDWQPGVDPADELSNRAVPGRLRPIRSPRPATRTSCTSSMPTARTCWASCSTPPDRDVDAARRRTGTPTATATACPATSTATR